MAPMPPKVHESGRGRALPSPPPPPATKVRENGVVVLVPRYGIEGIVYVCESGAKNPFVFDEAEETLRSPSCTLRTFDKVRVRISVDATKAHRPKLKLRITKPVLPTA